MSPGASGVGGDCLEPQSESHPLPRMPGPYSPREVRVRVRPHIEPPVVGINATAGVVDRAASDAQILKHVPYMVQVGVILLHHLDIEAISRAVWDAALGIEVAPNEGCLLGVCQRQG